jgi:phage terminase large subunit-like protein
METRTVKAVRRTGRVPQKVYNLKIKKNHNYFVNGVLVHNCDDPHDPEQGASESQRQVALDTWTNKFSTRGIVKGVKKLIGAQRLHEEDLSGYVLANEEGVAHLCIPMEFDPDRRCTTRLKYVEIDSPAENGREVVIERWTDPRTERGELMWPQGLDAPKVSKLKKRLRRAHAIAGQLQQQPTSPEGDMFQREWFLDVVDDVPEGCEAVRAWDKATTTGRRSDYTAGVLAVSDGKFIYIANVRRGKWKRKRREKIIQDVTQEDMDLHGRYQVRLVSDVGAAGSDAAEVSAEDLAETTAVQVRIDKPAGKPGRKDNSEKGWSIWAELLSRGRVRIVRGAWNQPFMDEHMAAPFGAHDDQIDAASHAVRVLWRKMRKGKIRRNLLVVTPEEQAALVERDAADGKQLCEQCVGLGCAACGGSGFVRLAGGNGVGGDWSHENDLQAIFDAACRSGSAVEAELGVMW